MSGKREAFLLSAIPAVTFAVVWAASASVGMAHEPGCNSASNFVANLFFLPTNASSCRSVPFLSDIPTVLLSLTCPFAFVAFRLLRRRLILLLAAATTTGLVSEREAESLGSMGRRHLEAALDMTAFRRIALFVLSFAMTGWLYSRDLTDGHIFDTLANERASATELRDAWWANYHHHPALAFVCVFVGAIGVNYALRAAWLYLRLVFVVLALRNNTITLEFVPRWRDKSYGWSPVTGVLLLIYLSTVNFAISMVAIFDMLRNETWTLLVDSAFALLGVVSNIAIVLASFFMMLAGHRAVEQRLRHTLLRWTPQSSNEMTLGEYVVATSELTLWRRIPVSSFSGSVIKIIPGLYALFQFIRVFWGANG